MLESNTFRMMMIVLGVIVAGVLMAGFFTYPVIELDDTSSTVYKNIMMSENKDHLSVYDVLIFNIKAIPRTNVKHY